MRVKRLPRGENGIDQMQEFAHKGGDDSKFGFASTQQVLGKGTQDGIMALSDNSGEIQGAAQTGTTPFGQASTSTHGRTGNMLAWGQTSKSRQLAGIVEDTSIADFSQQFGSGQVSNPRNRSQQIALLTEMRMALNMVMNLAQQVGNLLVEEGDMLVQGVQDRLGRDARLTTIAFLLTHIRQVFQMTRQCLQFLLFGRRWLPGGPAGSSLCAF